MKQYLFLFFMFECISILSGQTIRFDSPVYKDSLVYRNTKIDSVSRKYLEEDNSLNVTISSPKIIFDSVTFQNKFDFRRTVFLNEATFDRSTIYNLAAFNVCCFNKNVSFQHVVFNNNAQFNFAKFQKNANFSHAKFNYVDFENVTFSERGIFSYSTMNSIARFVNLNLSDSSFLIFRDTRLPRRINFSSNSHIKNEIDFTDAYFDKDSLYTDSVRQWHYINLYKSDISKVIIDYEHFRLYFLPDKRLSKYYFKESLLNIYRKDLVALYQRPDMQSDVFNVFPSCLYHSYDDFTLTLSDKIIQLFLKHIIWGAAPPLRDSVIIEYLKSGTNKNAFPQSLSNEEILSIYEKVLKNFADRGQMLSYKKLDIECQDFKHGANILPHIWNCYGYHKEWVFYWAFWFLCIFTLVTFTCLGFLWENVYSLSYFEKEDVSWGHPFTRLWYSIVYTSVIFFLFSLKMENFHFGKGLWKILGSVYVILVYTAGIACIAYMANFVLQK